MPDLISRMLEDARLDPPEPGAERERRVEIYERLVEVESEQARLAEEKAELWAELGDSWITERRFA